MNTSNRQTTKDVQEYLNKMGYPVAVDGLWGPETESAYNQMVSKATGASISASPTLDLQKMLNSYGYNLVEDGLWGPKTKAAYDSFLNQAKEIQSSSSLAQENQPFSEDIRKEEREKAQKAAEPYWEELSEYERANTEEMLRQKQLQYQNFLANAREAFQKEKEQQDQTSADQGVLFSGGRYQKLQKLGDTYKQNEDYQRSLYGGDIAATARDYQYAYGDKAARKLSDYYRLGTNVYNPNVAQGGAKQGTSSRIYKPSSYDFYGTREKSKLSDIDQRTAGLLWNKSNKLTGGYNYY